MLSVEALLRGPFRKEPAIHNLRRKGVPERYFDASPDWDLILALILADVLPRVGNGRLWNPAFMEYLYMDEPDVDSRYRARKVSI
jgi:hypothetical protein